ncbi:MAG: hypothetical protein APF80_16040 [Alphaproteobacteria bacterium BRH_c36]|nr:MAG: hypothetical protein APF80_16040 [Alphaproteobacteria bacterium BRH_c36]
MPVPALRLPRPIVAFVFTIIATSLFPALAAAETAVKVDAPDEQVKSVPVGVRIENRSEPVLCAEKDNVTLTFAHPKLTQFRIEAAHPSYINALQKDSFAPDWTSCDIAAEATSQPPPEKITLYEDVNIWVVGFRFPNFWRKREVPFRVGAKTYDGLHLVQVWVRHDERAEEVLVVYPTDGYWRARPLPPRHLGWSAYGSSFMVGPIEDAGRPVVNLASIGFDPRDRKFALKFAGGGLATLVMSQLDREVQVIDVAFEEPINGPPFAALRSMYITRFNNDVAEVAVLEDGAASWREQSVMAFGNAASAHEIWTGRLYPSRHNTSAPDMVFRNFAAPMPASAPPAAAGAANDRPAASKP